MLDMRWFLRSGNVRLFTLDRSLMVLLMVGGYGCQVSGLDL